MQRGRRASLADDLKLIELVLENARKGINAYTTAREHKIAYQQVYRVLKRRNRIDDYRRIIYRLEKD